MLDKVKILLSKLWARRKERSFLFSTGIIALALPVIFLLATQPSYEPDGLEVEESPSDTYFEMQHNYDVLAANYQQQTSDYNAMRDSFITAASALETSNLASETYKDAYYELFDSYRVLLVNIQLQQTNNENYNQSVNISQSFRNQYSTLILIHEELKAEYNELNGNVKMLKDKSFFEVTDNITQSQIDTFYHGWDIWIDSITEEESDNGNP